MKNFLAHFIVLLVVCKFGSVFNFEGEYDQVANLCKINKDCSIKYNQEKNRIELYKLMEQYFVNYWRQNNCLNENEPCGSNWGYCCQELECRLLVQENSVNEDIGLCSFSNETYLNEI